MRVFQHNTFTLTIHFLCWAKIRSNYFKPYYYSVTMFNLHYSQLTLLINFTWKLLYNILHCNLHIKNIAKFVIKYFNQVSKYISLENSKWLELEKYHIFPNAQKNNARKFTTLNQFFFPFEAILPRDNFTQNTDAISSSLFSNLLVFLQCYIFLSFKYLWCYFPREVDTHHAKEK